MGSFTLDPQRFAEKCAERADDAVGNIVVRIAAELDKRSPVGDATYWKNPPLLDTSAGISRQLAAWRGRNADGRNPRRTAPAKRRRAASWPKSPNRPRARSLHREQRAICPAARIRSVKAGTARAVGLTVTMFQDIVRDAVEAPP